MTVSDPQTSTIITALRSEIHGRFATVDARLDRGVQALTDRYWGHDRHE